MTESDAEGTLPRAALTDVPLDEAATSKLPAVDVDDAAATALRSALPEGTQEIRAEDVLEVLDKHLPAPAPAHAPVAFEPLATRPERQERQDQGSIAAIAMEVSPPPPRPALLDSVTATATASFATVALPPPKRLRLIVEAVMAGSLLILGAAIVRAHLTPDEPETPPIVFLPSSTAEPQPPPRPAAELPQAQPTPTVGTVTRPHGMKLQIDGARVNAASAVIPCGQHVVKLGNEKPRSVLVPCNGNVSLEPGAK